MCSLVPQITEKIVESSSSCRTPWGRLWPSHQSWRNRETQFEITYGEVCNGSTRESTQFTTYRMFFSFGEADRVCRFLRCVVVAKSLMLDAFCVCFSFFVGTHFADDSRFARWMFLRHLRLSFTVCPPRPRGSGSVHEALLRVHQSQ